MGDVVRVDKWLWSVRIYKTRSQANEACAAGRVRVNGDIAKPATKLKIGDQLDVRRRDRTLLLEVVQLLEKRVSPTLAAEAYIDSSPPAPINDKRQPLFEPVIARREQGAGRPTKRDRRDMEKLRKQFGQGG